MAYIVGFAGMEQEEADELLVELYAWQSRDEFRLQPPLGERYAGHVG